MDNDVNVVLAASVDQLGKLNAKIAKLEAEAKVLKEVLVASGQAEIKGEKFKARISQVAGGVKVDWKAVAEKLEPSRQLVQAYSKKASDSIRVALFDL